MRIRLEIVAGNERFKVTDEVDNFVIQEGFIKLIQKGQIKEMHNIKYIRSIYIGNNTKEEIELGLS